MPFQAKKYFIGGKLTCTNSTGGEQQVQNIIVLQERQELVYELCLLEQVVGPLFCLAIFEQGFSGFIGKSSHAYRFIQVFIPHIVDRAPCPSHDEGS